MMSASTVIGDVSDTLVQLLTDEQQLEDTFEITLKSPAVEVIDEDTPKINLYLYQIVENPEARNRYWPPENTGTLRYPPLTLSLSYVLTPFAKEHIDEQRVLGEAMRIFHENTILRGDVLQGGLANTGEELALDLCKLTLEEVTRIWNAFNVAYRLSVCYAVRIVHVDSVTERTVQRVIEKENRHSQSHGE